MANFPYQFPLVFFNSHNIPSTLDNMHAMEKETMITSTMSCSSTTINNGTFQPIPMLDNIHASEHIDCSFGREVAFDTGELSALVSQELKHVDEVQKKSKRKRKNIEFEAGKEEKSGKKVRHASTSKVASTRTSLKNNRKGQKKAPEGATAEYVHVRARRGEATDSHSLAERARRERISERFRLLQSIVPGCDKMTGKARILDTVINYVQSMQNHVEVLAGTLSSASLMIDSIGTEFSTGTISTMDNHVMGLPPQLKREDVLSEAFKEEMITSTSLVIGESEILSWSFDEQTQTW